jgi:hypothetical protein
VFADYDQSATGGVVSGLRADEAESLPARYFATAATAEAKVASRLTLQYSTI